MINSLRQNKFAINMLIAIAVFLNAIAPLSVVAKEFSVSDNASAESLFGNKILICTPTGFKYISIDELHERQKNGQDEQQNHCLLCQIKAPENILIAFNLTNSVEFQHHNSINEFYGVDRSQKPKPIFKAAIPRAPPFFL